MSAPPKTVADASDKSGLESLFRAVLQYRSESESDAVVAPEDTMELTLEVETEL